MATNRKKTIKEMEAEWDSTHENEGKNARNTGKTIKEMEAEWDRGSTQRNAIFAANDYNTLSTNLPGYIKSYTDSRYQLGGSAAIKNSGVISEFATYDKYVPIISRNFAAGKDYLGYSDEELAEYQRQMLALAEEAQRGYNQAKARTGALDSIDTTGMPKAQQQELGRMGNLSQRDTVYEKLQQNPDQEYYEHNYGEIFQGMSEKEYLEELKAYLRTQKREDKSNAEVKKWADDAQAVESSVQGNSDYIQGKQYWRSLDRGLLNSGQNVFNVDGEELAYDDYMRNVEKSYINDYLGAIKKGDDNTIVELMDVGSAFPELDRKFSVDTLYKMDPTQVDTALKYVNNDDMEGLYKYLGMIDAGVAQKAVEEWNANAAEWADKSVGNQILGTVASFPMNLVGGFYGAMDEASALLEDKFGFKPIGSEYANTQANAGRVLMGISDTFRGEMGQTITDATPFLNYGNGKNLANTAFQGIASLGDSLLAGVTGPLQWVTMFGQEAGRILYEQKDAGNNNASIYAAGVGVISAAMEKVGIDSLFKGSMKKAILGNAGEEGLTEIANVIFDKIVNGNDSEFNRLADQYHVYGYGNKAEFRAALDIALNVGEATLGGMFAGLAGGAPDAIAARNEGKNIIDNEAQYDLADLAEIVGVDGQAADIMRRLQAERTDKAKGDKAEAAIAEKGGVTKADAEAAAREAEMTERDKAERADETKEIAEEDVAAVTAEDVEALENAEQTERDKAERAEDGKSVPEQDAASVTAEDVNAAKAKEQAKRDRKENAGKKKGAKAVSKAEIGYLYRETMSKLDKEAQNIVSKNFSRDIRSELDMLGYEGDSKQASEAIAKFAMGEIAPETLDVLENSKVARDIALSYVGKVDYRNSLYDRAYGIAQRASKDYVKPEDTKAEKGTQEATQGIDDRAAATAEDIAVSDVPESMVDGKAITIEGVAGVAEDGSVTYTVKDADGNVSEVSEADVEIGQNDETIATLSALAKDLGKNAGTMIRMYAGSQNVEEYATEFRQAMQYGEDGRNLDVIKGYTELNGLNPEQITAAYEIGRGRRTLRNQKAVRKNAAGITVGKVDTNGINREILDDNQRAAIDFMSELAGIAGFNVRFVESSSNAQGKYADEAGEGFNQGEWNARTMTLTLDVHAGSNSLNDGQFAMMHTAGHELTHYIRQFADTDLWNDYQEFVIGHLSRKGFDFENEIEFHMEKEGLDRDGAIEEIIADASGEALNNITEADIQSLAETNPSLLSRIKAFFKQWISDLKARITEAYKGTEAKTEAGRQMVETVDEMSKRWNALFINATRNRMRQNDGAEGEKEYTAREGDVDFVDYAWPGEVKYQARKGIEFAEDKYFGQLIDRIENAKDGSYIKVGKIQPESVLNKVGVPANDLYFDVSKIRKQLEDHNDHVDAEVLKSIPDILRNPVVIAEANVKNTVNVFGNMWVSESPVMVGIVVTRGRNGQNVINKVRTIHARRDYMNKITDESVLYLDSNKKRTLEWFQARGNVVPLGGTKFGFIRSIAQRDPDVKFSVRRTEDPDTVRSMELYEEYQKAQKNLQEIENQYREASQNEELMDAMMTYVSYAGSRFTPEGKAEKKRLFRVVQDIQKKLGIEGLSERKDKAQERVKTAKKAMEDFESEVAVKKERQAIEKSGLTEAEYFAKRAVKEFGYTTTFTDAGYMLQNGKLLNFSGEKGKHFGTRGQDHRAIGVIYEKTSGTHALTRFLNDGNIRVIAESPGLDIASAKEPTTQQYTQIRKFAAEYADKRFLNVDFSDENGKVIGSLVYDGKIVPDKVVNDIKYYYQTGEIREQSALSAFRYQARNLSQMSDREILADAMMTIAKTPAEQDILGRYRKRIANLNEKQRDLEGYSARIRELREKGLTSGNSDELSTLLRKSREAKEFITKWDKQLLERESTSFMQTMLEHTKAQIAKESRAQGKKAAASRVSKAKSKAKIIAEVSRLQRWIAHPSNKEHVPEFLAKPIGDILKEFDYSGGMTLKTREIFESGDEAAMLEWRKNVKARKDAAERRYKEALKEYEKTVDEGDEKKIEAAEKKVNRTKGAYESLADAYERGIESASQAFSRADSKFVRALQDMSDAISRIGRAQRGLEENAVEFSGWLDLTEATEMQFGNLVKEIRDTLEKTYAMKDTPVNRMTAEQLDALAEAMAQIRKAVVDANQLMQNVMFGKATTAAYDTIQRAERLGERKAQNKALAQVGDFINWKNVTPIYVFERFGKAGKAMFSELQDGHDQLARNIAQLKAYSDKAYTPDEINKWSKELHEFKLSSGKTVQMTTAQVMSLYCLNRRDQARGHLLGGGIRVENIEHKGKLITQAEDYTLFEGDIEKITGNLTKRQKEVADALQKFMSTVCADWGNVVSMKRFGYQMFTEGLYFPIESDTNNLRGIDEQARANDMFRLLNLSATKALTEGANNAIVVRNIFDVFAAHSSDMAKYNALAIPILDTLKWYNYVSKSKIKDKDGKEKQIATASVRKSLEMAYGKEAVNYITTFIKDLNGVHDGGRDDGFVNKLTSNYKIASTGMNLRVMLLQMSSIPRAMYELSPIRLAGALAKSTVSIRKSAAAAKENVGIAQWKALGFYDTNIASNVRDMIKHDTNFVDWFKEISTKGAAAMDSFTMGVIYNAVQMEISAKHKDVKPGTAEYNYLLNKRVREVVYKTQVVDSTMTRSQTMRDKGRMSAFTNFMSEPTLALSMISESVNQMMLEKRIGKEFLEEERGDDKRTPKARMASGFIAFSASALTAALLESLFDAFRDDDEYETFAEKYWSTFAGNVKSNFNPLEMIPILSDIASAIQGYENERMETSFIYNGVEALKKIYDYIKDPEGKEVYSVIYSSLQALSQMTGLAVSNLVRDAISIYNTWIAEPLNKPRIQTRKESEKTVATAVYKAAMSGDTVKFEKLMGRAELYGITAEDLENEYNNLVSDDYLAGNINSDEAKRVFKMYGGKTEYQAQTLVDKLDYEKATGRKYSKVESEYVSGAISKADAKKALTTYGDTTAADADAKILTWDYEKATGRKYSAISNEYIRGTISRSEIKKAMVNYGGQSSGDAEKTILHLDYQKKTNRPWSKLMDDYIGGRFTRGQVKDYLMNYDLKDENEAMDTVDKYDWAKTHGGSTDGYSKYVTVHEAIDSGRGFDEAVEALVEKYTARGETRKEVLSSIRSSITSKYKPIYLAASETEQARMREELLDVYVALGGKYSTYYKNMTDKWFED